VGVSIRELFRDTDRLLRGQFTRREDLMKGRIEIPVRTLVIAGASLGAAYGLFMGLYALFRPENVSFAQLIVTMLKVPLLFLLTLAITFPSLYVFSALARSRLKELDTLRLLLGAVTVNLALLASFGPVTGFFTLSTTSYAFMKVLNVIFFAISGFAGLVFLRRALDSVFVGEAPAVEEDAPPEETSDAKAPEAGDREFSIAEPETPPPPPSPTTRSIRPTPPTWPPADRAPRRIFAAWIVMYSVVGAQMGWILRPFIGSPDLPFELFRERQSSFFEALWQAIGNLF
jgi:hypothetical protein